jgi:hypothetical protein
MECKYDVIGIGGDGIGLDRAWGLYHLISRAGDWM